jgi:hypothetical protein
MRPLKIPEYGNASFLSVLGFLVLSLIYAARNLICEKDVTFFYGFLSFLPALFFLCILVTIVKYRQK